MENQIATQRHDESGDENALSTQSTYISDFIHIPPDLLKKLGKSWYLDLEKHYGNSALMLMIPNCPNCSHLTSIMTSAQAIAKKNKQLFLVYCIVISTNDIYSDSLHRNLGISHFPALYCVDRKGRINSWVPHCLDYEGNDPFGMKRITARNILETFGLKTTA